jgi:putative acetyltransferase
VALSRLKSPARALALGPVAVRTARQGQGVGSALVRQANARARELGFDIIFVLGDPGYYSRFGFSVAEAAPFPSPYAGPHFMALRLSERSVPPVPVIYPRAFDKLE